MESLMPVMAPHAAVADAAERQARQYAPILPDTMRAMAPPEGMWRLVPSMEVALAVWEAYHGDQLHWYVPAELKEFDREVTEFPERVRDERAKMFGFAS